MFAAAIIAENADGSLRHFDRLGFIAVGTTLLAVFAMYFVAERRGAPRRQDDRGKLCVCDLHLRPSLALALKGRF